MMTTAFSGIMTSLTYTLWFETNTEEADYTLFSTTSAANQISPRSPLTWFVFHRLSCPYPGVP